MSRSHTRVAVPCIALGPATVAVMALVLDQTRTIKTCGNESAPAIACSVLAQGVGSSMVSSRTRAARMTARPRRWSSRRVAWRLFGLTQTRRGRGIGGYPLPTNGLGQSCPEDRVATAYRCLPHLQGPHSRVPTLDIGHSQPGDRHRGDRVGDDRPDPAALIAPGRFGPRRIAHLDPSVENVSQRPAGGLCGWPSLKGRGKTLGVTLRPLQRPADLSGPPAIIPAGEDPDLPNPPPLLANGRHEGSCSGL